MLLGEADPIRALQLHPGVESTSAGLNGLHVRGNSPANNLVLLDGVPVYNISHFLGLFSIFNPSLINKLNLYKSGIPNKYSGRISSILDITMREGNKEEFNGEASIGLLTSKLTLEGPLSKSESSYIVSGRYSPLEWYLQPLTEKISNDNLSANYKLYDISLKLSSTAGDKNRISLSFYKSRDFFRTSGSLIDNINGLESTNSFDYGLRWKNSFLAIRWNHIHNKKLYHNLTAYNSSYDYSIDYQTLYDEKRDKRVVYENSTKSLYSSRIQTSGVKFDLHYIHNSQRRINFGFELENYHFDLGTLDLLFTENNNTVTDEIIRNGLYLTFAVKGYVENRYRLSNSLFFNTGLTAVFFSSHRQHLSFLEPRFNLLYKIDDKNQLSIAFDKTNQFLHLLTNNGVGLPTDLWVPLINELKGISAKQYSLNYSNRLNQKLTFELGLYYKSLNNLIEFEEGEGFIADGNWVEKVTQGTGTVYGVETSISGNIGNTQGFLNYTFSKSKR